MKTKFAEYLIKNLMGEKALKVNIIASDIIQIEIENNDIMIGGAYWDDKLNHCLSFKKVNAKIEKVSDTVHKIFVI